MLKINIDATQRLAKKISLQKHEATKIEILAQVEGDIDIVTSLADLLTQNKLSLTQIGEFTFTDGSGSFTGIKVSAAIATVLEWALNNKSISELKVPEYGGEPNITLSKTSP